MEDKLKNVKMETLTQSAVEEKTEHSFFLFALVPRGMPFLKTAYSVASQT